MGDLIPSQVNFICTAPFTNRIVSRGQYWNYSSSCRRENDYPQWSKSDRKAHSWTSSTGHISRTRKQNTAKRMKWPVKQLNTLLAKKLHWNEKANQKLELCIINIKFSSLIIIKGPKIKWKQGCARLIYHLAGYRWQRDASPLLSSSGMVFPMR